MKSEGKIREKAKIFSFDILLYIIVFSVLGFVVAIMFFSFNVLAYFLLTFGGVILGVVAGIIMGKKEIFKNKE
jgi:uncharacterized membrane protein SpoIIM required for sporulation